MQERAYFARMKENNCVQMHLQKGPAAGEFQKRGGGKKVQKGLPFHRMQVSFNLTFLLSGSYDTGDKDDLFSPQII